jgi:hypothetical protein
MIIQYPVKLDDVDQVKVGELCRAMGRAMTVEEVLLLLLHTAHAELVQAHDVTALDAQAILTLLRRCPGPMTATDLQRRAPRAMRSSGARVREALAWLAERRLIQKVGNARYAVADA